MMAIIFWVPGAGFGRSKSRMGNGECQLGKITDGTFLRLFRHQ